MAWVGNVRTDVTWTWDGSAWRRVQNGTPHGRRRAVRAIGPRNVVMLFVRYEDTGSATSLEPAVPEAKLIGEGEAWVLREGTIARGKWIKATDEAPDAARRRQGRAGAACCPARPGSSCPLPGMASVG